MSFFPEVAAPDDRVEPEEYIPPSWSGPPDDVLPGVVPVELILGQSASTVVMLTGIRAFPTGLDMTLGVRVRSRPKRGDLHSEVFGGPYDHDMDAGWQAGRLKWGFELADGVRVTNVDPPLDLPDRDDEGATSWEPDRPLLTDRGGGGGSRSVDHACWLWPLPPAGPLRVVCQWLDQDIDLTVTELDTQPLLDAAARAHPLWPAGQ
jgi:hypothetical protein